MSPGRPVRVSGTGTGAWRRTALAVGALAGAWLLWTALQWAVVHAVWRPDLAACQALRQQGACWGVVAHKGTDWLLGSYPLGLRSQAGGALLLWAGAVGLCVRGVWRADRGDGRRSLAMGLSLWGLALGTLAGTWPGLVPVESALWGGLPLTVLLASSAWAASLPLGALLAWGRQTGPVWLAWPCAGLIEWVRGVPLVMWLFMAAFLLPALWPQSAQGLGPVMRVWLVMTIFSAAYAAEILRGALGVLGRDPIEAAHLLGASRRDIHLRVIWPQVFQTSLPPLASHCIGLLKDTSLVMIVNLHDLTGAMSISLNGDPDWRPFFLEAYLAIAACYALMCLGVAAVGRKLESQRPSLSMGW